MLRATIGIDRDGNVIPTDIDSETNIRQAINKIYSTYGVNVSVEAKKKDLIKFGNNENVQTSASTIWFTGQDEQNETLVADNVNSIDTISSSSAADTEIVDIEGHTMSAGERVFVKQLATLDGQNKVPLTTPLNRVSRVRHAMQSSTSILGEVYVYEDTAISSGKPTDTTKIHITMPAGNNTSEKASTSLSGVDYWIVTNFHAEMQEKSTNLFANVSLQVKPVGGVFYPASDPVIVSSGRGSSYAFDPYIVIPANADIRLVGIASSNGVEISGGISGYLATIVD